MNQEAKPQQQPTAPPGCRCGGTGAYTAEISVSDAVVLVRRVCLDHLALRTRLKDNSTGRVGEVMEVNKAYERVHLRPVGGGKEWSTYASSLEPPADQA